MEKLLCPMTSELMDDPVKAEDGCTYSRKGIEAWFNHLRSQNLPIVSPLERKEIGDKLEPDQRTAAKVSEFKKQARQSSSEENDMKVAGTIFRMFLGVPSSTNANKRMTMKTMLAGTSSIHDLRSIFATLDELRPILTASLKGWQPPQVVMIGQESSGKSSVLERLAMMPLFPRDRNICTRLPIHVHLRYSENSQPATLQVFNKVTNKFEGPEYCIPTSTGAVDVRKKMQELLKMEKPGALSTERTIILSVKSPNVASIDLVDMPGIVALPAENREASIKLFKSHIEQHGSYSMFLATVPAAERPNQSIAMQLLEEHGLKDKTVGVFTMCDEIAGNESRQKWEHFIQRLDGQADDHDDGRVRLDPHGWVAVVNEAVQEERVSGPMARLFLQAADEKRFVQKKLKEQANKHLAGTDALVQKLNCLFLQFVSEKWVPDTVKQLESTIAASKLENALLGEPPFHVVADAEKAAQAKQLAAKEASKILAACTGTLVQQCCSKLLRSVRQRLLTIAQQLHQVPADRVSEKWKEQRTMLEKALTTGVEEWATFWETEVRKVLEKRTVNSGYPQKHLANPQLELWRFPAYIDKVLEHLNELVGDSKASILEAAEHCVEEYYKPMSPFVAVCCDFAASPPTVSMNGRNQEFIDNIMLAFLRCSNTLLSERLPENLDDVGADLSPSQWRESCSQQRSKLLADIQNMEEAKQRIEKMARSVA